MDTIRPVNLSSASRPNQNYESLFFSGIRGTDSIPFAPSPFGEIIALLSGFTRSPKRFLQALVQVKTQLTLRVFYNSVVQLVQVLFSRSSIGIAHAALILAVSWWAAALRLPFLGCAWPACAACPALAFSLPSAAFSRPAWYQCTFKGLKGLQKAASWPWLACRFIRAASLPPALPAALRCALLQAPKEGLRLRLALLACCLLPACCFFAAFALAWLFLACLLRLRLFP